MFKPERFARMTSGLPQVERYVADGDTLRWGDGEWLALQTDGHAQGPSVPVERQLRAC